MKHYLVIFGILFFIIISLSSINANAESSLNNKNPSPQLQQNNDPNETILKYEEFLRSESKEHRDYLESFYTKIIWIIGILGSILVLILTFLNWKSKKDVTDEVNKHYETAIRTKVDAILKESKQKSNEQIEQFNKLLNASEQKSNEQISKLEDNLKKVNKLIYELTSLTSTNTAQQKSKPSYKSIKHNVAFYAQKNKEIPYEIELLKDTGNINIINISSPEELSKLDKIDLVISGNTNHVFDTKINNIPVIQFAENNSTVNFKTNISSGTQFLQEVQQHLNDKDTTQ